MVVALGCLGFQLWLPSTHVNEADYGAVAKVLEAERQEGDVVLLVPWWTERARITIPPGIPVVGYQGSDQADLERYRRIWVLSSPRLPRAGIQDFQRAFSPLRSPAGEVRHFGNLDLQLYHNGRFRLFTLDAAEALSQARVYLEDARGSRQACTWDGRGHRCPNGRTVAKEWHEVHFAPYACLRLDAPGGSTKVVVEFTSPAADFTSISAGYVGELGACREGCTASTVWFEAGSSTQTLALPTGHEQMVRAEGPALTEGALIRIALASDNPQARTVCVVMEASRKSI